MLDDTPYTKIMTFTVVQRFLTRKNADEYRGIFKKCFPKTSWKQSVPFPKDSVYAAVNERGQVVGYCMVHNEPPQKMSQGAGGYMYNLCVAPESRRLGAGSAILREVARNHPRCYSHMDQTDDERNHAFMARLGWVRVGAVRQFYEYALLPQSDQPAKATEFVAQLVNPRQYDAENNVIYLDA
jgi:ribosomal protein S18 acetylase RimI-like enzyme